MPRVSSTPSLSRKNEVRALRPRDTPGRSIDIGRGAGLDLRPCASSLFFSSPSFSRSSSDWRSLFLPLRERNAAAAAPENEETGRKKAIRPPPATPLNVLAGSAFPPSSPAQSIFLPQIPRPVALLTPAPHRSSRHFPTVSTTLRNASFPDPEPRRTIHFPALRKGELRPHASGPSSEKL